MTTTNKAAPPGLAQQSARNPAGGITDAKFAQLKSPLGLPGDFTGAQQLGKQIAQDYADGASLVQNPAAKVVMGAFSAAASPIGHAELSFVGLEKSL